MKIRNVAKKIRLYIAIPVVLVLGGYLTASAQNKQQYATPRLEAADPADMVEGVVLHRIMGVPSWIENDTHKAVRVRAVRRGLEVGEQTTWMKKIPPLMKLQNVEGDAFYIYTEEGGLLGFIHGTDKNTLKVEENKYESGKANTAAGALRPANKANKKKAH